MLEFFSLCISQQVTAPLIMVLATKQLKNPKSFHGLAWALD